MPPAPGQEYEFSLRVVTPTGGSLATVPGLLLLALPDLPDYVPPPASQVVKIKQLGGKLGLTTQPSSPVPEACLPRYLEVASAPAGPLAEPPPCQAVDAFAWRLEAAANGAGERTREAEVGLGRAQDLVEVTQQRILAK